MARGAIDISLLGDKELDRVFAKVERGAPALVRKSMRPAFKPVLEAAKQKAAAATNPENPTDLMLRVSRKLKLRAQKRSRRSVGLEILTPTRAEIGLKEWSKTGGGRWYSPAHAELGTRKMRGIRYMRDALAEKKLRVFRLLRVRIWRELQALGKRGVK